MIFVLKVLMILCGVIFSALVYQVAKARALLSCGVLVDAIRVGIGPGISLSFPPFFGRTEIRFCLFPIWVSLDVRKVDLLSVPGMGYIDEASVYSSGMWASLSVSQIAWLFGMAATMAPQRAYSFAGYATVSILVALIVCFRLRLVLGFISPILWFAAGLFVLDDSLRGNFFQSVVMMDIPYIAKWMAMRIRMVPDFLNVVMYSSLGLFAMNLLPIPFFDGWELLLSVIALNPKENEIRSRREAYPHAS